jgi:hypothetical protein
MPERGRLATSEVAIIDRSGAAEAPWVSHGTTVHAATFEVKTDAALDALPAPLARPAPAYARIYVVSYPESPFGPYNEALLMVSCRYLMLPRQYLVASIVDSEAARDANEQNGHYRSDLGQITTELGNLNAVSRVIGPGGLRVVLASEEGEPTSVDVLRYDPVVVVQPGGDALKVLTVSAAPENIRDAFIATGTRVEVSVDSAVSPWARLRSTNPITGTFARMDLEIPEAKEVELPPMMAAAASARPA